MMQFCFLLALRVKGGFLGVNKMCVTRCYLCLRFVFMSWTIFEVTLLYIDEQTIGEGEKKLPCMHNSNEQDIFLLFVCTNNITSEGFLDKKSLTIRWCVSAESFVWLVRNRSLLSIVKARKLQYACCFRIIKLFIYVPQGRHWEEE